MTASEGVDALDLDPGIKASPRSARRVPSTVDPFAFEVLEPRILLSASEPTTDGSADEGEQILRPCELMAEDEELGGLENTGWGDDDFAFEAMDGDDFAAAPESGEAADEPAEGSDTGESGDQGATPREAVAPAGEDLDLSVGESPLASSHHADELVTTLLAANPPPGSAAADDSGALWLEDGDRLHGTGDFPSIHNESGVLAPGNSPGVMNVPTFSQGSEGVLEVEIEGTGVGQFDQLNVAGLAELDGTLEIVLFNGFVPSAGQSFEILTYGSRDGEFAHWLGTTGVPGNDSLAFVPEYDDLAGTLTLTVVATPTVVPAVGTTLNSALSSLQGIGDSLDGLDEFAQTLPLLGDSLGSLVDVGQAIQDVLVDQLNAILAATPTQAEVTAWIEGWEGTVAGGAFEIDVLGVLGHYGSAFSWEIQFTATQTHLNQALTDVTGAVLDAVFDPAPMVDVAGILEFDFELGYDSGAYVAIDALTARATVDASGTGGFGFDFTPPGGPLDLDVTGWSVDFDAAVTAVPDPSILTSGRIPLAALGSLSVADDFNLEDLGTVDASFTLDGALSGFVFDYSGTHTVRIESDDLFDEATVDLTVVIDGALTVLDQDISGIFTLRKTATETILEGESITIDLEAGGLRVLLAENGSGTFLVLDDGLAGSASLTITEGPALPNLDISGSTLELTLNTSGDAVTSIGGVATALPAGPYFKLAGDAVVTLDVPDVSLTGSFVFEPRDTDMNPGNGNEEVYIAASEVEVEFDDGLAAVLQVSNGSGAFVIDDDGIAGETTADVMLALVGINLSGAFTLRLNDTNAAKTVELDGSPVLLPAGPYLRVEAEDATLDLLGLAITGDFSFEQRETDSGGEKVVTLAADDVQLPLGTLTSDLITFENGSGLFLLTSEGVAGEASGDVSLGVPSVGLTGAFDLVVNTTETMVDETVDLGSGSQAVSIPAGPYLQLNGSGVALTLGALELTGDFSFEQRETTGGTQLVTVMADNVSFDFGTDLVTATNGSGLFLFTDAGMAGQGMIDLALSAFGESFVLPFSWSFNDTGMAIDDAVDWEGDLKEFDLPSGPFNRFSSGGPIGFEIEAGGQTQSVTAAVVVSLVEGPPEYVTVGVSEFSTTLGAGPLAIEVLDGTGALAIFEEGIAGRVTAGSASLTGAPGISLSAMGLAIEFNGTGMDIGPVVVAISDNPADDVSLQFSGSEFHDFIALAGTAELDAGGVVTLGGDFQIRGSGSTFEVGVQDLHFDVTAGTFTAVAFENGTGAFVIDSAGVAGEATIDFEAGIVGLMGSAGLMLNTTQSTASGSVLLPDGSTLAFAGIAANSFMVTLSDAHLNVGPVSVEIPGGIKISKVGGNVEVSRLSGGALLATIDPSGALTINDSAILDQLTDLAGFGELDATDFVGMLRSLLNWLAVFQDSAVFDINIPFTENTTLGDALAWADAVYDELYAFVISIELQSVADFDDFFDSNPSLGFSELEFDLQIGEFLYEGITIPAVGAGVITSLGDNEMPADASSLVGHFNNALSGYALEPAGAPQLHQVLVARANGSPGDFRRFALALTEQGIVDHGGLQLVDPDSDFSDLGFPEDTGTAVDDSVVQTAVTTSRYSNPEFIEALGDRIVSALGGDPSQMPDYDPATLLYAFPLAFEYSPDIPPVNFDFDEDLGPIGASGSGELTITPTLSLDFTIGFDLNAREVPRVLSSTFIPVPANGRISEDAHFEILIGENPDSSGASWIELTLPQAVTAGNNSVEDLAEDFNDLFASEPYGSGSLLDYIYVQKAGSVLAISVLDEDLDNDGKFDTVNEDVNDNSVLDGTEDADGDGDGNLDVVEEDWSRNGQLDDLTGTINLLSVRSLQDDVFATELGFGVEAYQDPVDSGLYFRSVAVAPVKGLFIEDANFSASVAVETTDNITGSVSLGFLEISLDDPGPNGIGTVDPYTYDPGADTDVFDPSSPDPSPITVSLGLVDAHTGESRLYLNELLDGLEVANIADMVVGPEISGSLFLSIADLSASVGSVNLPTGVEIYLWIPDITELDYNPDPYHSQTNHEGIFITYPDLGAFGNFEDVGFSDIIRALRAISGTLSELSAFSFLDQRLPLIDISINDMLAWAEKLAELFEGLQGAGSQDSIQELLTELEDQIELLFNLDPEDSDIFDIDFDTSGITLSPVAAGGGAGTAATASYAPDGDNNDLLFTSSVPGSGFNGAVIRIIGSATIEGDNAMATWDEANKVLTIEINGGVTTAGTIIAAVAGIAGTPWVASLAPGDNAAAGNDGSGTYSTAAIKFTLNYSTGYADSLPFMLNLQELVDQLGVSNAGLQQLLDALTTLVSIETSGMLTVSASADATVSFGLDLTNPGEVKPFLYDETGVVLRAKVLGTEIAFEAALGGIVGIFVEDGTVTLDRDGDPETGAGEDDEGAEFNFGLRDNNGDGRHYFTENLFSSESIDLGLVGGVSAVLPMFAPTPGTTLGSDTDEDGDGFPDNALAIDIPDLARLFTDPRALNGIATVRMPGDDNDFTITGNPSVPDNFRVVFVEGGGPASFDGETLTIPVTSGVTTANQVESAVESLGPFTVNDLGGDNGTGPVSESPLALAAPDFSQLFADLDLCELIFSNFGLVLDGLDDLLGRLEDGLESIVSDNSLPLVGDGLMGAANFIADFRGGLLNSLRTAIDAAGGDAQTALENAIKEAFWNSLGPGGLDILVDPETGDPLDPSLGFAQLDVTVDCDDGLIANLRLGKQLALVDTTSNPIDFDIGIPGLGLEVDGNVVVAIGFDVKFGFGYDTDNGFWFDTSASGSDPEMRLYFEATIPGLSATGQLLFLELMASDSDDDPSFFVGQFVIDIMDPGGDGKLSFAEITSPGTNLADLVHADLEAVADVTIDLAASFGGNAAFPRVLATFNLDWSWSLQNGATSPVVEFTDLYLDAGTFLSEFLAPVLAEIQKVTQPIQPLIDVVTARLPVFSDLAGRKITLLTLSEVFGLLEPSTVRFIENVAAIIELINDLDGLGEGSLLIPFSAFTMSFDDDGQRESLDFLDDLSAIDFEDALMNASGPDSGSSYQSASAGFAGKVDSLDNFSIPIFDNPAELINLFIPGSPPVRLVEWRMPTFRFEFEWIQQIPIYPPLYAQLGGGAFAEINIGFGYDIFGIQKFVSSEDKNALDIFDGFYVIDYDENGNERPEVLLGGEIFAGVELNLTVVKVGVRGGVYVEIGFDLHDVTPDGRVRPSDIIAAIQIDPSCLFDIHGEIGLFLEAFLEVDLFFFSIKKEWRFAEIVLISFDLMCPEPILASESGGNLTVHSGPNAGARAEIDTTDGDETFTVTHLSGDAGSGEEVEVIWGNWRQVFTIGAGGKLILHGGNGNDYFELRGIVSPVEVHGGIGNDQIFLSEVMGSEAWGDEGNDIILVSPLDGATHAPGMIVVTLNGGDGNDILTAGPAAIRINGDGGADTITGSPDDDELNGGDGADHIEAGEGDDMVDGGAGNDFIEAYTGNDIVHAGPGNDIVRGSRGDDELYGDEGDDELIGASGNDILVGGAGADLINGHGGIDLLIGDDVGSIVGNVGDIPTLGITVTGLGGNGNDILIGGGNIDALFGVGGDDFLYGGNLFNKGDTGVIEEDHNDFLDGGPGDDTIFADDAMGRTGDRDTGIAIRSSIWLDVDLDGLRGEDEQGFAGVTVILYKDDFPVPVEITRTETDSVGAFDFTGLDPGRYLLEFESVTGLMFADMNVNGGEARTYSDDSDADATGTTDQFLLDFDETLIAIGAGYTGDPKIVVSDVTVEEGNDGPTEVLFRVEFSGPAGEPTEVDYQILGASALFSDGDYEPIDGLSGTLSFGPFETDKVIAVNVLGDRKYEDHEQFQLVLTNPFGGPDEVALATILNDDAIPAISIRDSAPAPGQAEIDDVVFVVELSNPSEETITVNFRTDAAYNSMALPVGSAATLFDEFPALTDEVLTFQPGDIRQEIRISMPVATADDTLDEFDETFYVDLYDATNGVIDDYRGVGTIVDDDDPVSVSISPGTISVPEGDSGYTPVPLTLSLDAPSGKPVTITYATAPGTARETPWFAGMTPPGDSPLEDYLGLPVAGIDPETASEVELGIVVIEPGSTSAMIIAQIRGDLVDEVDEIFFVNILSAEHAVVARDPAVETNHTTIEIQDDDAPGLLVEGDSDIRFEQTLYVIDEPDSGSDFVTVTMVRSSGVGQGLAVLTVREGTATAGADYTGFSVLDRQLVIFEPGEVEKTIDIEILSDATVEGNETILLDLRRPTGQPMPVSPYEKSRVIIRDPLELEITQVLPVPPEGTDAGGAPFSTQNYQFFVSLKDGAVAPAGGVEVDFETLSITANGGALPILGTDFIHTSGTAVIPMGMTTTVINVAIVEDDKPETTETFAVRLSNPDGAELADEDRAVIATIYDDDKVEVTGTVFYDRNGNGFQDFNEGGIDGVTVAVAYEQNGVAMLDLVETDSSGLYTAGIFLGPVTVVVNGTTVKSPYQTQDNTSPYYYLSLLDALGEYETTTFNEVQAVELDMVVTGPDTFDPVGYDNSFSTGFPEESDDVGRGGTDDTIFGGPGDDFIDAGSGDDHVVGGHWMNATDMNVPVNTVVDGGTYDATLTVTDISTSLPAGVDFHPVYDDGPIFSVDLGGLNLAGVVEGDIFIDTNDDGFQGIFPFLEPYLQEPVVVSLLDGAGNVVNSVVTNTGQYRFDNIYVGASPSTYVVEFLIPEGYDFAAHSLPANLINNDVFLGARTDKFTIDNGSPQAFDIDAAVLPSEFIPTLGSGYGFDKPSYSVDQEAGELEIIVLRGDSSKREVLVYSLEDGTAVGGAGPPANYLDQSGLVIFEPGETFQVITIEVFDSGLGFCDFLDFTVTLRRPTGQPLAGVEVYMFGGVDPITDDDTIDGNDDWDIILGDSGVIPGYAVVATTVPFDPEAPTDDRFADLISNPQNMGDIRYFGGPGLDVIDGGGGPDFIDGQLEDDLIAGGGGVDFIRSGIGNDVVVLEDGDDQVDDVYGRDRIVSQRDVPLTELTRDLGAGPDQLIHYRSDGVTPISVFTLFDDVFGDPAFEIAQVTGGFRANTFDISGWTGSIYLNGAGGRDSLVVENDVDQMLLTNSNLPLLPAAIFRSLYGYLKNASLSLSTGETYHLGSIEEVTLIGGPGDNVIDASGYSRTPVTFEGRGGDDTLVGSPRVDRFVFDADTPLGTDTVVGGGGRDTLDFSPTQQAVNVDLAVMAPSLQAVNGSLSLVLGDLIENVTGGDGNDTLAGNNLDNVLLGGPGNDTLIGRGGDETYAFDSDSLGETETIVEAVGGGNDTLDFSALPVSVDVNLAITGTQSVTPNLAIEVNDGLGGEGEIERVVGTAFDDVIRGNAFDNALFGGAGDDLLDGKSGDDLVVGGEGNDDLDGGAGANDRVRAEGDTDFTLSDSRLTRGDGEEDELDDFEFAELFGGVGPNVFDLSGWTGDGLLDGRDDTDPTMPPPERIDTVVAAVDADFTLTDASLTISRVAGGTSSFALTGIDLAILSGGPGDNAIDASAFTGSAWLSGGEGDDDLEGGSGSDILLGGLGADELTGGPGNDLLVGGGGIDTLVEDFGALGVGLRIAAEPDGLGAVALNPLPVGEVAYSSDQLAEIENLELTGTAFNDDIDVSGWTSGSLSVDGGGGGSDRLFVVGGDGDDSVVLTDTAVSFAGSGAIAIAGFEIVEIHGGGGDDILDASAFTAGNTRLLGGDGNDVLTGGAMIDLLDGGAGDDRFVYLENGVADIDLVLGGDGVDTIDFGAFSLPIQLQLGNTAIQTVEASELDIRIPFADVENAVGGSGGDTITGSADDNEITGGGGADQLDGLGGTDTVRVEADADIKLTDALVDLGGTIDMIANFSRAILVGGAGNNLIDASGFSGIARIEDGAGDDTVRGSAGGTIFVAGAGDDDFVGSASNDLYVFDVDGPLGADSIDDAGGIDGIDFSLTTMFGVSVDLSITGAAQTVHAANLTLTLVAGTVLENIAGGEQADSLVGNAADNVIRGGLGDDTMKGAGGIDIVAAGRDADITLTDTSLLFVDADPLTPDEFDSLSEIEGALLLGGDGANTLDASAFSLGNVTLIGGAGNDLLLGGLKNDSLSGGAGNDILRGGLGNDLLEGGDGNDDLTGGEGDDDLRGGNGNDIYRFNQVFDIGVDTLLEAPGGGAYDLILGLGLAGIDIDLHSTLPQMIGNVTLTLSGAAVIEDAY